MHRRRAPARRAVALWPACAAAAGAALVYVLAAGTREGRTFDARALALPDHGTAASAVTALALVVNPVTVFVVIAALTIRASRMRAWSELLEPAAVVVGAVALAHGVEALLGAVDPWGWESRRALGAAFYPSGHSAAIMAMALAFRPSTRRLAVLATFAAAAAAAPHYLALWHHPSDVVGGFFVATAWTLAVQTALVPRGSAAPIPRAGVVLAIAALAAVWPAAGAVGVLHADGVAPAVAGLAILAASACCVVMWTHVATRSAV